jgi:hypothetical protein
LPVKIDLARLGYHWATVMVNLQYLPFAAGASPNNVSGMVERATRALDMMAGLAFL